MADTDTDTLTSSSTRTDTTTGSHDKYTHIVIEAFRLDDNTLLPLGNCVVDARINNTPITALCGKVWVPTDDPSRYPLCPTCKEEAAKLGSPVPGG